MDKRVDLKFDYLEKDKVVATVTVWEDRKIDCELLTDDIMDNPLPFGNNSKSLLHFLHSRCFPETRANKNELLEMMSLTTYSPLSIVKKTRGQQNDDFYWIRLEGDTAKWDDIKIRD